MRSRLGLVPLLLLIASSGCTTEYGGNVPSHECQRVGDEPTWGREGQLSFVWGQGLFTCLFGCTADNPLVSSGTASLAIVNADGLGTLAIESSDEAVLDVEHAEGSSWMSVAGVAPGDAEIRVMSDGEIVDALVVRVRDVYEALTYDEIRVYRDADAVLSVELYDDEGCRMVGTGAIEYALADGLGPEHLDLDPPNPPELNDSFEQLAVRGGEPGSGGLAVSGPGLDDVLPLAVLGPEAVDSIHLTDSVDTPVGSTSYLYPHVYDANGDEILGAVCEWSMDPVDSPIQWISHGDSVELTSDIAAEAILTCTIGSASAQVSVRYT